MNVKPCSLNRFRWFFMFQKVLDLYFSFFWLSYFADVDLWDNRPGLLKQISQSPGCVLICHQTTLQDCNLINHTFGTCYVFTTYKPCFNGFERSGGSHKQVVIKDTSFADIMSLTHTINLTLGMIVHFLTETMPISCPCVHQDDYLWLWHGLVCPTGQYGASGSLRFRIPWCRYSSRHPWKSKNSIYGIAVVVSKIHVSKIRKWNNRKILIMNFQKHLKLSKTVHWACFYVHLKIITKTDQMNSFRWFLVLSKKNIANIF